MRLPRTALPACLAVFAACADVPEDGPPSMADSLPACASPYLEPIVRATQDYVGRSSVDEQRFLTSHNVADPTVRIDGPQIFPAFRELIGRARHEVDLQTYVWEPDTDPVNEILAGLLDLQRRKALEPAGEPPVTVRFLFDVSDLDFGSTITAIPATWAAVQYFGIDPAYINLEIAGYHHQTFGNLHVKTLVVDGKKAIITGANPQAHHDYAEPWRDAGYLISGEVASALQDDFDDAWMMGVPWTCGADGTKPASECAGEPAPIEHAFAAEEAGRMAPDACLPMLVTERRAQPAIGSNHLDSTQDQAFLAAFKTANDAIRMQTPNLNDDAAKRALLDAVERGVRVDLVLSKGFNESTEALPGQGGSNADTVDELYDTLAAEGIPEDELCSRMRIRWHGRNGVAVEGNGVYASHAKYTSIDGAVVIVGTANMDTQSWNNSREVNVLVDDATTTRAWDEQLFGLDFDGGVIVDRCR